MKPVIYILSVVFLPVLIMLTACPVDGGGDTGDPEPSWKTVGTAGFSEGTVLNTTLFVNNGTPYVAFMDGMTSNKITVMKYD